MSSSRICLSRAAIFLFALALSIGAAAQTPNEPATWFLDNPGWSQAASVTLGDEAPAFQVEQEGQGPLLFYKGSPKPTAQLRSYAYFGDCVIRMEFLTTPDAKAGLYLEGRFRIELGAGEIGRLGAAAETKPAEGAAVAAASTSAPANPPGWQVLEVKFRAPRYDDARNQTERPLVIEARVNGKIFHSNIVPPGISRGTEFNWNDAFGPATIAVEQGSVALRQFSMRRTDFDAVQVPQISGKPTNATRLVDFVKQGDELFHTLGCAECHATQRDDTSAKTGPNLFGLFTLEPRDRVIAAAEGHRFTIKADRAYLHRSLRAPAEELAISERGPNMGQAYPIIMPPFVGTVITDAQVDAIGSYLATLNDPNRQGPVIHLVEQTGPKNYDPLTDRQQLLVDRRVRIQRGPMEGVSGRSIHVGQPNGINYTFDPRVLGLAKIWQGGFIDATGEFTNRGGAGLKPGYESREIDLGSSAVLLAPLNARGEPVDFSFKEPKFRDAEAIAKSLNHPRDHLELLKEVDAQFLGYARDSRDPQASPAFKYRVGGNAVSVRTEFAGDGGVRILVEGDFATTQSFVVNDAVLSNVKVSGGTLAAGLWTLPAGKHKRVVATGMLTVAQNVWRPKPADFGYSRQPLVIEASTSNLPPGYSAETYASPKDNYGREQLFEPLGVAVAPDSTIVVATRTAGIWRLVKGEWRLFAEGLFDSLGVQVEDEHGLTVVAGQKAELTRITDTDGDGLADKFETLSDAFSYNGNYHAYMHGPVRDRDGSYFIALNLDDAGNYEYEYRAGGKYMGTGGGFRAWAVHVPAQGGFEPWADGLRSPASLGFAPDGRLWYAENQGEFVGTSKLFVLKKGGFYGHPASLVDRPGMTPASPEIAWDKVKGHREMPVVLFPQSRVANSPGNPAWDTTNGRFGPFAGSMFIGDQTQSDLLRVVTEKVGDHEQGVVITFGADLQSGVMRPVFLPDGSLLVGQTGRGWQAKGGKVASLQRISWDGKTVTPSIHHVKATPGGFDIVLTVPVPTTVSDADATTALAVKSWVYRDAPDYGSPELDEHTEELARVALAPDRKSIRVTLANTNQPRIHPEQTARVYQLSLDGARLFNVKAPGFDAYYTLYEFPAESGSAH